MILYLHIGIEKTGSSYLQSLAAINREQLRMKGIWFPLAGKREQQLLRGQISAGNAQPITNALMSGDNRKTAQILRQCLKDAQKRECQKVLLSNELLLLALSRKGKVNTFQKTLQAVGFSKVYYFLVVREPVEQALSLYKHRAKTGTAADIEAWSAENYYYGKGLKSFLQQAEFNQLALTCRKYTVQEGHLEKLFYSEWLGLNIKKLETPQKRVNPSLSISELLLIRELRKKDSLLPEILYDILLRLPRNHKAGEPRIENYYKAILNNELSRYTDTWDICNQHLPKETPLLLPTEHEVKPEKVMTFTVQQGEVIASLMYQLCSPKFLLQLSLIKYKRKLGRLRSIVVRKLIP